MSAPNVDPPRQEMQTVAPNLPVGPYLINVTGKTFVSDVFLDVAVTDNGQPAPDGIMVTFDAVPATSGDSTLIGANPIHLSAVTTAGHAKFVPDIAAPTSLADLPSLTDRDPRRDRLCPAGVLSPAAH